MDDNGGSKQTTKRFSVYTENITNHLELKKTELLIVDADIILPNGLQSVSEIMSNLIINTKTSRLKRGWY